jgi:hypothetical protein
MLRKCVFAFVLVAFSVGILSAAELTGRITKVEGNKITFEEGKKGDDGKFVYGTAKTYTVKEGAKIMKGGKKNAEPTALTGGLTADIFKNATEKAVKAKITTDDSNVVTEIITQGGGKGKKKKDAGQ